MFKEILEDMQQKEHADNLAMELAKEYAPKLRDLIDEYAAKEREIYQEPEENLISYLSVAFKLTSALLKYSDMPGYRKAADFINGKQNLRKIDLLIQNFLNEDIIKELDSKDEDC